MDNNDIAIVSSIRRNSVADRQAQCRRNSGEDSSLDFELARVLKEKSFKNQKQTNTNTCIVPKD